MITMPRIFVGVAVASLLPLSALAQSNDAAYCQALVQKYETYVSKKDVSHRGGQAPNASVDTAISQCPTQPGASIPVLEKALQNAKVDLPKRG